MSKHSVIIKNLVDFGLSEKEAAVYVALLESEAATAQQVANVTKINRSSVYVTLDSLIKVGLVSISNDKNVQRYIATSPDILVRSVDNKISHQQEVKRRLTQVVPELKGLYGSTEHKPKVRVFEGKEGLIAALEDSLDCDEKLLRVASSVTSMVELLPDYFIQYVKRRIEKGIKMRGIHPEDEIAKKLMKMSPKIDTPILVPEDKYPFPADMAIYDNKISFSSSQGGGFAIIIESDEISEIMKNLYDMAWEEAKRLSKEKSRRAFTQPEIC